MSASSEVATTEAGYDGRHAPRINPFVGPRSMGPEDQIHGRDTEIERIRGLLTAERIVLVYSPSGAGKSSLIEAGLRERLQDPGLPVGQRFHVPVTIRVGLETDDAGEVANRYSASVIATS